ncbi:MAG: ergothioneine biosynthesis protein EgtB [Acidobacteriota bacterium]|nr:ergothioneine biosynthesis protein EgtB [Acidobacteriota bacterium]
MQGTNLKKSEARSLSELYLSVRAYTERLCAPLEIEDYVPQPVPDVSPPKWNIAHTTWFFEEMILKRFAPEYQVFNPDYGFLFNSYYNTLGERTRRDRRGDLSRPTVREIFAYRKYVDERMRDFLRNDLDKAARELVLLGLNHEQQHQELFLTDLKYIFSCNPLFPVYDAENVREENGEIAASEKDKYIEINSGIYEIGYNGDGFCFDNELGRHKVYLNDFSIRQNPVTNGEFLEFIRDGGYRNFNLWHSEGWDWVRENDVQSPLYWHEKDGEWFQFTLSGLRRIKAENPVCHVSFYEAAAFAEWKGARLATEFEWEAASARFDWGWRWEWTNSAYLPYPNFKKAAGAVGEYNGKFMINQMVLRGASVATPPNHSRPSYRNFFHPHLRWQFTGVRLAK